MFLNRGACIAEKARKVISFSRDANRSVRLKKAEAAINNWEKELLRIEGNPKSRKTQAT